MDRDISLYQQVSAQFQPLGQIEALLLTTYGLDVGYLEKSILPAFFPSLGEGPATEPHRPLFEYLEETHTPISVMYDVNQLLRGETVLDDTANVTKELRWQAHAVMKEGGCFHPKVIVALTNNGDQRYLVIACSSANLTRPGWGLNYEACAFEVVPLNENMQSSLLIDVIQLLQSLQSHIPDSESLNRILEVLVSIQPRAAGWRVSNGRYRTRLWFGQEKMSLGKWLQKCVLRDDLKIGQEQGCWSLEVLSPYYSMQVPGLIRWASDTFSKRGVEIGSAPILLFCPKDGDLIDLDTEVVTAFASVKHAAWAEFPGDRLRSQLRDIEGNRQQRFLHAKVYRFWTPRCEVLVVGSANATTYGNRDNASAANTEACLVFSRSVPEGLGSLKPWLRRLDGAIDSSQCRKSSRQNEDTPPDVAVPALRISFDWQSKILGVVSLDSRKLSIHLGTERTPLITVQSGENPSIPLVSDQIQTLFISPAVRVVSSEKAWLCLVEEKNLHLKPPAPTMERNIDDLIRDWQLGSDQRQAEHIARAAMPDDLRSSADGTSPELDEGAEQDRLNDIFTAMDRFRKDILTRLQNTENLEAFTRLQIQARLFGKGAMSVRYLLEKICAPDISEQGSAESPVFDVIEQYLALMSLHDALQRLVEPINAAGMAEDMSELLKEVKDTIADAQNRVIPALEQDESSPDARTLLAWIDDHFSYDQRAEFAL